MHMESKVVSDGAVLTKSSSKEATFILASAQASGAMLWAVSGSNHLLRRAALPHPCQHQPLAQAEELAYFG